MYRRSRNGGHASPWTAALIVGVLAVGLGGAVAYNARRPYRVTPTPTAYRAPLTPYQNVPGGAATTPAEYYNTSMGGAPGTGATTGFTARGTTGYTAGTVHRGYGTTGYSATTPGYNTTTPGYAAPAPGYGTTGASGYSGIGAPGPTGQSIPGATGHGTAGGTRSTAPAYPHMGQSNVMPPPSAPNLGGLGISRSLMTTTPSSQMTGTATPPQPSAAPKNVAGEGSMETQMLQLVNNERTRVGLPALTADPLLMKIARTKSQDMINRNYFSHQSPTYGSPFDMLRSFGVTYRAAGENIALNQSTPAAHTALMNSTGHRANILNRNYTKVGIGIVKGSQGYYFTQTFTG